MQYISVQNMMSAIYKSINHLQKMNIGLVVGIPRSGMLPANIIALQLNVPFTDIDSFMSGRIYGMGARRQYIQAKSNNVLVIDDSISSGHAINLARQKLKAITGFHIYYGAIFARTASKKLVDFYTDIIDGNRIFEWHLFHNQVILSKSCVDIDGVLCNDPTPKENDDGANYKHFLTNATPKFIPTVTIGALVTCRLEKYRAETTEWLSKHNIKYNKLIMMNLPNAQARQAWGKYGEFKAMEFGKSEYIFCIESSLREATRIKELTHKMVFCTETMNVV